MESSNDIWFYVMVICAISAWLLYLMIFAGMFVQKRTEIIHLQELTGHCNRECSSLGKDFYKVDAFRSHPFTNYTCWCIEENKPFSLGNIYGV